MKLVVWWEKKNLFLTLTALPIEITKCRLYICAYRALTLLYQKIYFHYKQYNSWRTFSDMWDNYFYDWRSCRFINLNFFLSMQGKLLFTYTIELLLLIIFPPKKVKVSRYRLLHNAVPDISFNVLVCIDLVFLFVYISLVY